MNKDTWGLFGVRRSAFGVSRYRRPAGRLGVDEDVSQPRNAERRTPNTALLFSLLMLVLVLVGCGDDRGARNVPQPPPWPEEGAPDALHSLSEDLLAFQATHGRLPKDIALLDRSGLNTGGPYATKGYAYHPSGIGVLRDGWRVVAADDRVREQDRIWCVVRPPVRISGTPGLRVVLVPLPELRQAASAAGGGI